MNNAESTFEWFACGAACWTGSGVDDLDEAMLPQSPVEKELVGDRSFDDPPSPRNDFLADLSSMECTLDSLLDAAEEGSCARVRHVLASGRVDVNAVDENDYSALLTSAEQGHLEVVCLLLEAGADLELRDSFGRSALYAAAVAGREPVVRALVSVGADLETQDAEGRTPLWASCFVRHLDVAATLLESEECNINSRPASGETALEHAIKHGHAAVITLLNEHGAEDESLGRLSASIR